MTHTIELSKELIKRPSVTPSDAGCQQLIADRLSKIGFKCEPMRFGEVDNLWARRGDSKPLFVFAGHTDVVPTGPEDQWKHPPFSARYEDGMLHGRGASDMKTAIAAMVTAVERFIQRHPQHKGCIGFLLTSDEEGPGVDGTAKVIKTLSDRGEHIDFCIVGEPTSVSTVGDTIKNGRRGSLNAQLTVHGLQGHVAYPERAANAAHLFAPALAELVASSWDNGNEYFSPTTFQVSNITAGTGAENVVPGELKALFNFRFSTESTPDLLKEKVERILVNHNLNFTLSWRLSGYPFLTHPGDLTAAVHKAIKETVGIETELSTSGGTSDARFIAPTGAQVIELGLVNATIHQIDEHVKASDIDILSRTYERTLEILLS